MRTEFKLAPFAIQLERRREINVEGVIKEEAVAAAGQASVRAMVDLHASLIGDGGVDFSRHTIVVCIKQMQT